MSQRQRRSGYVLHVDESGDDGYNVVRPIDPHGASEWMILSGVLVRNENALKTADWVRQFKQTIRGAQRPDLHYSDLSDHKRLELCQFIAQRPLRCFAVISNKRNMRGHRNLRAERWDTRHPFYNWMLRILLEKASQFCAGRSMRDYGEMRSMSVQLGARGGVSVPRIRVYLYKLKNQSQARRLFIKRDDLAWEVMDLEDIFTVPAAKGPGIQLADAVAGAFRQATEVRAHGTIEPQYATALRQVMALNARGAMAGFSVKLLPDPPALWQAGLTQDHVRFLRSAATSAEFSCRLKSGS